MGACETRHADAAEGSRVVETGAIVLTGMGFALVHVRFASRPRESLRTVAGERAGRVHANTVVLARGSLLALVDVLRAVDPLVTGGAGAGERSVDRARVADRALVAGIRGARVVQMAQ